MGAPPRAGPRQHAGKRDRAGPRRDGQALPRVQRGARGAARRDPRRRARERGQGAPHPRAPGARGRRFRGPLRLHQRRRRPGDRGVRADRAARGGRSGSRSARRDALRRDHPPHPDVRGSPAARRRHHPSRPEALPPPAGASARLPALPVPRRREPHRRPARDRRPAGAPPGAGPPLPGIRAHAAGWSGAPSLPGLGARRFLRAPAPAREEAPLGDGAGLRQRVPDLRPVPEPPGVRAHRPLTAVPGRHDRPRVLRGEPVRAGPASRPEPAGHPAGPARARLRRVEGGSPAARPVRQGARRRPRGHRAQGRRALRPPALPDGHRLADRRPRLSGRDTVGGRVGVGRVLRPLGRAARARGVERRQAEDPGRHRARPGRGARDHLERARRLPGSLLRRADSAPRRATPGRSGATGPGLAGRRGSSATRGMGSALARPDAAAPSRGGGASGRGPGGGRRDRARSGRSLPEGA